MHVRLLDLELNARPCVTRLPFRFGISTMTEAPMLVATVRVATDSGEQTGHAADLLVPKWFAKNPRTTHGEDRRALMAAARQAAALIQERGASSLFDHWHAAQLALVEAAGEPLVAMFGVALVERAMIDALCRAAEIDIFGALDQNLFGIRFGEIDGSLEGWAPDQLGERSRAVRVRHTVGLVDDLDCSDLDGNEDRSDGHPLCLDEDIERYGLTSFKVKVGGDAAADTARLRRISALLPAGAEVTLDGNEQFTDPATLADVLDGLERDGGAPRLLDGLISIEQPVSRAATFDAATAPGVARLAGRAPVIIDEADATLTAFPRARALGYAGVSVKACKGVLRALLSRARIDAAGDGLQSAEDLTNLPPWPLLQDLALVSALRLEHVERNGHHYFHGADHLTVAERSSMVEQHPDLFGNDGRLRIDSGLLHLDSLGTAAGFGCSLAPDAGAQEVQI